MSELAFVFPGQGSQEVGMLADAKTMLGDTFGEASEVLGYDLWDLVANGPAERLNLTEYTQPALLTASVGLWRCYRDRKGPVPAVVAGHSLGEYSALVAAGVLEFPDAVELVRKRGRFMQLAVPEGEGGMAAILGLDDDAVNAVCEAVPGTVQAANYNAPGQVVLAGEMQALEAAIEACKSAGAKRAMRLTVSAPFHSSLMQPAAQQMADVLASVNFSAPEIPVVQNVNAQYCSDPATIRENLVMQMSNAVLWTDTVVQLARNGVNRIVECGPGKVLSGLNRRIDRSLTSHNIDSMASLESFLQETRS